MNEDLRLSALNQAIISFMDEPSTEEVVARAKAFEEFLQGGPFTSDATSEDTPDGEPSPQFEQMEQWLQLRPNLRHRAAARSRSAYDAYKYWAIGRQDLPNSLPPMSYDEYVTEIYKHL